MTMDNAANMIWAGDVSTTALMRIFAERKGDDPAKYNGITFFEAYDAGDSDAKESLQQMGRNTAAGIFAIQSILDLECYAIGGGISAQPALIEYIKRHLNRLYSDCPYQIPRAEIVTCKFQNDANLYGALQCYLENA
jgi:predicted NBD/HSP70 family sugar kinase